MSALSYLIVAVAKILGMIINLYTFIIAISVLLSWVNPDPTNPIVRLFRQLTEPVFQWVRSWLPKAFFRTGFDFSPVIVLFILIIVDTVLIQILYDLARSLRGGY
ncbi:MAG: YggT family protein [Deltaproteobacteria bacterium]|nr:YggT family protein [Deltaproteobacteria bacterium]